MATKLFVLLLFQAAYSIKPTAHLRNNNNDYGVMFDAGSSGTRVYLYHWPERTDKSVPLVEAAQVDQEAASLKIKPGLAAAAVGDVANYMKPLLDYLNQHVPAGKKSETPLYLKATAGMRLLEASNKTQSDLILEEVRAVFMSSGFKYMGNTSVQIMSGDYEGLFAWVCVNYLKDKLKSGAFGALDMGGASTQIAYVPSVGGDPTPTRVSFNGKRYSVYTRSYLGWGLNEMRTWYQTKISAGQTGTVSSPCDNAGFTYTATIGSATVSFSGTGQIAACRTTLLTLLNQNATCAAGQSATCRGPGCCNLNGQFQPPLPTYPFVALSGFFYAAEDLTNNTGVTANFSHFEAKATEFCNTNYATLNSNGILPTIGTQYGELLCNRAQWEVLLLGQGYGFNPATNIPPIEFSQSLNGVEVTWALGAMIYEANLFPIEVATSTDAADMLHPTRALPVILVAALAALLLY